MAFVERAVALRDRLPRALKVAQEGRFVPPEQPSSPVFSSAFRHRLEAQRTLDARYAGLSPIASPTQLPPGQDHEVIVVPTTEGRFVVKTLKPTSRAHLIFGLGVPAGEVPADGDTSGRRARLVNEASGTFVDPNTVAEKIRLVHVMASTYLDAGTGAIWPTAAVVWDGKVYEIQRYLPPPNPLLPLQRDSREIAIEQIEKAKLFRQLQDRWKPMQASADFRQLPPDVQDYWRTFPPDATATNAHFLGIGDVVAIDY